MPKIRCISSYVYLNYPNKSDLPILKQVKEIIPLSDCKVILKTLEQYSNKYNAVKINDQVFTKEYIKSLLKIHELIDIKKSVEIETRWLDQDFYNIPQRCKKLDEKKFMIYKEKLLLHADSICVDKAIPNLLTSDLALLTCNRWLNLSVIHVYVNLLNKEKESTKVIIFSAIQECSVERLTRLLTDWKNAGVESCCVIMNIRLSEKGKTFVADSTLSGNHWVCIYHHFSTNLWIYADSLGFSPPEHLFQTLRPFRETVQQIYVIDNCDDINLIIAHTHGIQSNINCTKRCIQHFPCQGNDMNICGVASIMSAIVLRNKRFISDILAHKKLPQIYSWLSKLERYSDFLRRVLIIWFLEKRIDLSLINMKTKVKEVPTFLKF